jgi:His-Xaa-Ser system protein HxsD
VIGLDKLEKTDKANKLGNIEIGEDCAVFSVNPKIYPLDIVYRAAYIMIDKAFIILDGDPEESIKIEIRKKKQEQELHELVKEFNEELLNYSVYKVQSEKNAVLRETILQRVLLTNVQANTPQKNKTYKPPRKNDDKSQ